jgi:hypothetical protein
VPEPSEDEIAVEKIKRHKSPGKSQIPSKLIKAGRITIHFEIYKLVNSIWNKEELPEKWKELIIIPIFLRRIKEQIAVIIKACHFCQHHTKFHPSSCCQGKLHMQRKLVGIISVDFNAIGQLLNM